MWEGVCGTAFVDGEGAVDSGVRPRFACRRGCEWVFVVVLVRSSLSE